MRDKFIVEAGLLRRSSFLNMSKSAQLLYFRLSSLTNLAGVFELDVGQVGRIFGRSDLEISEEVRELIKAGLLVVSSESSEAFITRFFQSENLRGIWRAKAVDAANQVMDQSLRKLVLSKIPPPAAQADETNHRIPQPQPSKPRAAEPSSALRRLMKMNSQSLSIN